MKYMYIIIASLALFFCGTIDSSLKIESKPKIHNGFIDLSSYDFEKLNTINLDGNWEFYWLRLYSSENFKNKTLPEPLRYFEMPGAWSQKDRINDNSVFGSFGHATYRLLIKVKNKQERYGLKIYEMNCAYKLFINGNLVSSKGMVSDNPETMKPQFLPDIIFFTSDSEFIEIILQVSNYVDNKGGSLHSIAFGLQNQIIAKKEKSLIAELFLFGILIILGIYHYLLYFIRINDPSLKYFGSICIMIAIRVALTGERFFYILVNNFNWDLFIKIEHLTIYLIFMAVMLFIQSLYKNDINRYFVNIMKIITGSFIIVVIITPAVIYSSFITVYVVGLILPFFYLLYVLVRAFIKKEN